MALPAVSDHIQIVVGMKSFFVAINVLSVLMVMMEMPWVGLLAFVREIEVGGLAGC